ncbi:hypothetical protein FWH58_02280 [Candidatus Saccharibacteria bacterium]|nr:hypothetical protein [Candidatus Saccharibacteria bacterium]
MKFKNLFLEAIKSRVFVALWMLMLIEVIALIILIAINIHPRQLQIPVHFDAFSVEQYFRDQWFYLFNFIAFGIAMFFLNSWVSLKILDIKGRHLALSFLCATVTVLFIVTILIAAILRVAGIQ